MLRRPAGHAAPDLLLTAAEAISVSTSHEAAAALVAALRAALGGLGAWAIRREGPGGAPAASWIPSDEPPPFPEKVLGQPGSAAAAALATGRAVEICPRQAGVERFAEAPYLRRAGGCWRIVPTAASEPAGAVVFGQPDHAAAEALLEAVAAAAALLQPWLALAQVRREMERRIEERTSELALFSETSRALAFAKTAEEVASLLGEDLGRALGLEILALLTLGSEGHHLHIIVLGDPTPAAARQFRRKVFKEAAVAFSGPSQPVAIHVKRAGPRPGPASQGVGADVHVPLSVQGRPVGFLSARTAGGPLDESRLRLLYTIAGQAALTLERVRTVEEAGLHKMRAVLDSMAEGVLLVDRDLRVILANPAARRLAGAILGGPIPRRLARLGSVALEPLLQRLAAGGRPPEPAEVVLEETDQILRVSVSPAHGLRGAFEGAVLVLTDVSEQRRIQAQLHQTEKLSSLGEMISGVAHELNNPLTSIIGFAQLLDQRGLQPDVAHKLAAISNEASRCHSIVQNLLRFARREAPERRPVDLNSVVGSVVQLLGYQLQVDDIAVDVDLDREMRPVLGDFHALQQVLVNLVRNAHQAMLEKEGRGLLRVVTRCDGDLCRMEVSDSGAGIRPEHLRKIFDPFFSTKKVGEGTGLGLSIAYGTVREHGGSIQVRSRPGRGSTFLVELPASAEVRESPAARPEAPPVVVRRSAGGRRILVVDDEANLADMIREALEAEGHHVDAACDGRTAAGLLRESSYDLIISDLKMPNMGGRELYEEISRRDPSLARRIIFSTGDSVSPETQAFFREVGNLYLTKPFNLAELYRTVHRALDEA
jgi:two-component system NtrC family sensor kinase